ncbi:hypothetical protein [Streptomyces sp. LARHCF252]
MGTRGSVVAVAAAGVVLALGGCGGGTGEKTDASASESAKPAQTRPPSGELVRWTGDLCASTVAVEELRAESAAELKEIRDPDEAGLSAQAQALSYVVRTPSEVRTVESELEGLGPSGVPAADRLLDAWQKKLKGVVSELDGVSPAVGLDEAEGSAADVDKLVQSLTPPKPDLPELTEKHPRLADAYRKAEQCAPGWKPGEGSGDTDSPAPDLDGPLPEPADGKNLTACSDGTCEILVTSEADLTANGVDLHITVGNSVTFRTPGSVMNLGGQGGVAQFGDDLKITVVAHNEDGAVLKFSKP